MNDILGGPQAVRLVLGLTGRRVVADIAATTEVLPSLPWVKLPGLKPWMRGVAVHQLDLLPVIDLSSILDAQPLPGPTEKHRIVSVGSGGFRTGFLVASVDAADDESGPSTDRVQDLEIIQLDNLCLELLADPRSHLASTDHD